MKKKELKTEYDLEMIKLRWDEFKFRHTHYWGLFFRFSFANLFLLTAPYLYPDAIKNISSYVLLFPVAGIFLCLSATWLLSAEYERLNSISRKLNDLTPDNYLPDRFELVGLKKILRFQVGTVVNIIFLVIFMILSFIEFIVIYNGGTLP